MALVKLSDYVTEFLAARGVRHVFVLPGGGAMHLDDSLGSCPDLEYVCFLHEQALAIATSDGSAGPDASAAEVAGAGR